MKGSIRQRSPGAWEITLSLGYDAAGRRTRRSVTVRGTKAEAQRRLRELLSTVDHGIPVPNDRILIRDWLDRWLDEVVDPNLRASTAERYRRIIERHLKPRTGHVTLGALAPKHVHSLQADLTARGMAPAGVQVVHAVLSGAMTHAMRMELLYRATPCRLSPGLPGHAVRSLRRTWWPCETSLRSPRPSSTTTTRSSGSSPIPVCEGARPRPLVGHRDGDVAGLPARADADDRRLVGVAGRVGEGVAQRLDDATPVR